MLRSDKNVYNDLDYEYDMTNDKVIHLARGDIMHGWSMWFSGTPIENFWIGLKKAGAVTGTYDPAWTMVHGGTFPDIPTAEAALGNLSIARLWMKTCMLMDKELA